MYSEWVKLYLSVPALHPLTALTSTYVQVLSADDHETVEIADTLVCKVRGNLKPSNKYPHRQLSSL